MTITITPVSFAAILSDPDAGALISEYAAECSIPEIGKPDPQPSIYAALEASGAMQCFAALEDGSLVGFACVLVTVLPHYGQKVATVESLFVSREHRSGGWGTALMDAVEQHGRESGCVGILYSARADSQLAKLLTAKAYPRTHVVFYRGLA